MNWEQILEFLGGISITDVRDFLLAVMFAMMIATCLAVIVIVRKVVRRVNGILGRVDALLDSIMAARDSIVNAKGNDEFNFMSWLVAPISYMIKRKFKKQ